MQSSLWKQAGPRRPARPGRLHVSEAGGRGVQGSCSSEAAAGGLAQEVIFRITWGMQVGQGEEERRGDGRLQSRARHRVDSRDESRMSS